jgi:hypothetical protein
VRRAARRCRTTDRDFSTRRASALDKPFDRATVSIQSRSIQKPKEIKMLIAPLAVQQTVQLATSALPRSAKTAAGSEPGGRTRLAAATALRRAADRLASEPAVLAPR